MEGLVGEEEDFVGYAGHDRQPVEMDEGGGVMCCHGFVFVSTLAAQFWTYWSLSRFFLGTPNRTPLQ